MESLKAIQQKQKVVFILGATGTGKSKLSIDLATRVPAEIVNSDKIQVLKGLDILTNKVTEEEKRGIPHHLLGVLDPEADLTVSDFCVLACCAIEAILEKDRLPIIVGGSNRYVEALVDDEKVGFRSKYECCFIWLDVATQVHHSYVAKRVDEMVSSGLIDEVRDVFKPDADYTKGIRQSIGVPEMDKYLRLESEVNEETRKELLKEAIDEIKDNTCKLIHRQLEKIHRLQNRPGWNIRRIDATEVFLKGGKEALVLWEKIVLEPSTKIVEHFLYGNTGCDDAPARYY
ncbi:tRNA dimethylallyltransferase [Thalictrum thalictroides]|uniref:adenylate dimethylallyltransferase (ADP/ATP-dependent) n=1 Tax=Thalictrum thalictroides TaxID=46969 RepID=A0A7J6X396_THATH|nr:tRNA dimethylallyltransferase [Thalictrum thalictroides]